MKKKIIHIVDTLCVGGREKIIIDICNNLDQKKYDVYIITLTNDINVIDNLINKDSVKYIELPVKHKEIIGLNTVLSFFKVVSLLKKHLNNIKPDIIHSHSYLHRLLIVYSAIKTLKYNVKVFHTVHTSGLYYNPKGVLDKIKLFIEKSIIGMIKPSLVSISEVIHENNERLLIDVAKQIKYIPNGIDLEFYNRDNFNVAPEVFGVNKADIVLTYVARLCVGKNHLTLLKAIKLIVKTHPDIKLLLAGDGETRNEIEQFIRIHSLEKNVILLGSISNIGDLLSITNIALFPSEFEGFTLTLIEKMAMGLPVVAANNDIFSRLIKHRENGLLFSMFDEHDLAKCVIELIENKELYLLLSKNGMIFSEQFSIKRMVNEHELYYES